MQSNNTLCNLLRNSATIVGAIGSAVSGVISYLFMPATYRWTLPLIGAAVLVVGVVVAALKEIGNRDRKITELEDEIKRIKQKPSFDAALQQEVQSKLSQCTEDTKKVLRHILMYEPIRLRAKQVSGLNSMQVDSAFAISEKNKLIVRIEQLYRNHNEIFLDIPEQFKPVLREITFLAARRTRGRFRSSRYYLNAISSKALHPLLAGLVAGVNNAIFKRRTCCSH